MKQIIFFKIRTFLIVILCSITLVKSQNNQTLLLDTITHSYKLKGDLLVNLSKKIMYKRTAQTDLYLYLLEPKTKKSNQLPAIIYFYGGGWVEGDVVAQIPTAAWFRDHGIIAITVDYRVAKRNGTTPIEAIEDAKSAVRYVRKNALELGVDPTKIIVAGGSAGGHLALCTLLMGGNSPTDELSISTKPNAMVLHNPVTGYDYGAYFFDKHPEFSPILHIEAGWPPMIISNGTNDTITAYEGAVKFTKKMNEHGNICELISVQGADHSCDWPISNPNFKPTLSRMYQFLVEQNIILPDSHD